MSATPLRLVCLSTAVLALVPASACRDPEPVLPGVPTARLTPADGHTPPAPDTPDVYERPPGVVLDVQHLCGHPLSEVRGEVLDQLGALVKSEELPAGRGEALHMERGEIRALEDRIYMLRLPLPSPCAAPTSCASSAFRPR